MQWTYALSRKFSDLWGPIADCYDRLKSANDAGADIYVLVQASDGQGRKDANIESGRAVFIDVDYPALFHGLPFEPTFEVRSKAGPHFYACKAPESSAWSIDETTQALKAAAVAAGTDPAVATDARIMRVPGFFHCKDPANKVMVQLYVPTGKPTTYDALADIGLPVMTAESLVSYRDWYTLSQVMARQIPAVKIAFLCH